MLTLFSGWNESACSLDFLSGVDQRVDFTFWVGCIRVLTLLSGWGGSVLSYFLGGVDWSSLYFLGGVDQSVDFYFWVGCIRVMTLLSGWDGLVFTLLSGWGGSEC